MSIENSCLPAGFEALAPFVASMALPNAQLRYQRRIDSTAEERKAFYEAARDLVQPGLDYLDSKALSDFDEKEERLMQLLLGFGHIAQAIEVQKDGEEDNARLRRGLRITRSSADGTRLIGA